MTDIQQEPIVIEPPTIQLLEPPYLYEENKVKTQTPKKGIHWNYNDQETANRYYKFLFAELNSHHFMVDQEENLVIINGDELSPKEKIIYQSFKKNMEDLINESITEGFTVIMEKFAANHEDYTLDENHNLVKTND
jgi:hypothetical protein